MNRVRARAAHVVAAPFARTGLLACLLTFAALLIPATALAGVPPEVATGQNPDLTPAWPQPVTASQEIVQGWINPHGLTTTYELEYAPSGAQFCTDGGTQNTDPHSTTSPATLQFTDSDRHLVSVTVTGLTSGTEYCSVLVASNSAGTTPGPTPDPISGLPTSFWAGVPFVTTAGVTVTGPQRVSVQGTVNPASQSTTYYALYNLASSAWCSSGGLSGSPLQSTPIPLPSQNSAPNTVTFNVTASDPHPLQPYTDYCVGIAARNASSDVGGTQLLTLGDGDSVSAFKTPPAATDRTIESTTATTVQLSGTVDPDGVNTTYYAAYAPVGSDWCQYGADSVDYSPTFTSTPQTLGFTDQNAHDVTVTIPGLTTGTTYCAVIQEHNSLLGVWQAPVDLTYPLPVVTAGLPTATSEDVNPDAPTTAAFDGTVSPAGQTTTYEVVYDLQSSNWCQGGGTPVDGASSGPTGVQVLPQTDSGTYEVTAHMTGLTPGAHYCAALAAVNGSNGQSGSPPLSFTGPPLDFTAGLAPTAGTSAVVDQSASTSAVSATVNAEGQSTAYHIAYDTAGSDWCNGAPVNPGSTTADVQVSPADLSDHQVTVNVTGLQGGTAYCAAMVATNGTGSVTGPQVQFLAGVPFATTDTVSSTSPTSELVSGTVTPTNQASTYQVAYDLASSEWCSNAGDQSTASFHTSPLALAPVDNTAHNVSVTVSGLSAGEGYCAELVAVNGSGVSPSSSSQPFTAGFPFTVVSSDTENLTASSVTIDGTVNPAGLATSYWVAYDFRASTWCSSGGSDGVPGQTTSPVSLPATDTLDHNVTGSVGGLIPGTDYCAALQAQNDMGTVTGAQVNFSTGGSEPDGPSFPGDGGDSTTPADPGTTADPGPTGTTPTKGSKPAHATVAAAAAASSGTAAQLSLGCPAASSAACRVSAKLTATESHRVVAIVGHKTVKRTVVVGTASATIAPGAHRTVTVSLNAAGRKLAKSGHGLKVRLSATQNGKTLTTRTLTLRGPKTKRK